MSVVAITLPVMWERESVAASTPPPCIDRRPSVRPSTGSRACRGGVEITGNGQEETGAKVTRAQRSTKDLTMDMAMSPDKKDGRTLKKFANSLVLSGILELYCCIGIDPQGPPNPQSLFSMIFFEPFLLPQMMSVYFRTVPGKSVFIRSFSLLLSKPAVNDRSI